MDKNKRIVQNLLFAFLAQLISMLLSFFISLVVPKILGVNEFGYWQLFLFYSGYIGLFHLGLNDGLYLKLGGFEYDKLNYRIIGSELRLSFIVHCIITILVVVFSTIFVEDIKRRFVLIATAIYLPLFNASGFLGYIFQAVNQTKQYSISAIIDKIFFISAVIALIILRFNNFVWIICFYIAGKVLSFVYCIWKGREIVFVKRVGLKITLKEIGINVSVGLNLLFSNIASMLILGSGRAVVDKIWGVTAFGKFSFSLTLTSFFLATIGQISMVLFPALRQANRAQQQKFYFISRDLLGVVLAGFLLAYMPLKYILGLLLPQYEESLRYLALLLPLCTYDGKMDLLCTTYFKVLKKEKLLLKINVVSFAVSLILSFVSGYVIKSVYAVVISIVVVVGFRSIISEINLAKIMGSTVIKDLIRESSLVIIFITCTWFISPVWGFMIYFMTYVAYLLSSKMKLVTIINSTKPYFTKQ